MSISPTDGQRSASNPPFGVPEENPSLDHGLLHPVHDAAPLGLQIDDESSSLLAGSAQSSTEPPARSPVEVSGKNLASFQYTSAASKNVNSKDSNAWKHSNGQQSGTYSQHQLSGPKGNSKFRSNKLEPQPNGAWAASVNIPFYDQQPLDSRDIQITTSQSASSRRSKVMTANHLLNFHYDPIPRSRPQQRMLPPRRQQRVKPYNKDLFLQANFKFVIYDSGRYSIESIDPDKMFPWDDVVCVRYTSPNPVQCPICLESPLCPQITSCGHIFCFPCVLRYLLMGVDDPKGESWKKCPLCFSMISSKDLYTIKIDDVKHFHIGDRADFALLARSKDSLIPLLKSQEAGLMHRSSKNKFNLFSKFILTSDIELSVKDAKKSLADWLRKADMGIVDDLEKLPYVCSALEQLEDRMKKWVENQVIIGSPQPSRSMVSSSPKVMHNPNSSNPSSFDSKIYTEHAQSDALAVSNTWMAGSSENGQVHEKLQFSENFSSSSHSETPSSFPELLYDEEKRLPKDLISCKDFGERDSYTFYQAIDGQPLILHPLSMKCLLHHYGSYDMLPPRIGGVILDLETITQSEAMRKRYRYLSHFSLTTTFQLCEIELAEILPPTSLAPFMDEIKKRDKQRKKLVKKEQEEKARTDAAHCAEVAALREMLNPTNQRYLSNKDTIFSLDEFEALGSGAVPSPNPTMNSERELFSNVTRLGYAAAHDSPAPRAEKSALSSRCVDANATEKASGSQGVGPAAMPLFANILMSTKNEGGPEMQNSNAILRKGKKSSRILLSTAGGRRY